MPILNDRVRDQVMEVFRDLTGPVRLVFFEQTLNCETCPEARHLVEEVASLSEKITFEPYNLITDSDRAREFRIDRVPAIAVVGAKDQGIRFFGTPSGHELGVLVETIQDVSSGHVNLRPETIEGLKALGSPVHLRIFVTPT